METRVPIEISEQEIPIVIYIGRLNHKKLHRNIGEIIENIGGSEIGAVKARQYKEYFYNMPENNLDIQVNISTSNLRYQLRRNNEKYGCASAVILLLGRNHLEMNYDTICLRDYIFDELSKIKNSIFRTDRTS